MDNQIPALALSQNWYPKRITWNDGCPTLKWQRIGNKEFTEPFYLDTLNRALSDIDVDKLFMDTSLGVLEALSEQLPSQKPDGFIFHMSRCGSTLLANMLRSHPRHLVISEAQPLDGVLRSHFNDSSITEEQRALWFKALVNIIGRQRDSQSHRYFIKLDCWHTSAIPFIRQLYPDTPCLFVYRSPAEVLASHHKLAGNQMVPGLIEAQWYTNEASVTETMTFQEYGVWVMEKILEAALLAHNDSPMLLVSYTEFPHAYTQKIAPFLNIPQGEANEAELNNTIKTHSKNIGETFCSDINEKQRIANSIYSDGQLDRVNNLYWEVEEARAKLKDIG